MSKSPTYNVILNGELVSGFETAAVVDAFAKMFKLSPEKTASMVGSRMVIKKDVELEVARTYQRKLNAIGIEVNLQMLGGLDELSLEPMEQHGTGADGAEEQLLEPGQMLCPKCNALQPKAELCSNCGVYIHKVLGLASAGADLSSRD
ncbi:hypothetical protein N8198_09415 [Gammaproteobacteria bacterium]|nr:hypothetical protein [Gammaproteobacteria bacterium]